MPDLSNNGQVDGQIERRQGLSYEQFEREYLLRFRPVIITDATKDWSALSKWTPDFFRKNFAEREIQANGQTYRVRNFIDLVEASTPERPAPYFRNEYMPNVFPELMGDVNPCPPCMAHNWLADRFYPSQLSAYLNKCSVPELYIGGAGGGFPFLHYDLYYTHAYLNQIYGRKLFFVFSPEQSELMYPDKTYKNQSMVRDAEHPDLEKFPLFAKATPIKFILEPGETVFLPAGWWHTTRMLTASITVSLNHANQSNWKNVVRDVRYELGRSDRFSTRLLSGPIAGYLRGVGVMKRLQNA